MLYKITKINKIKYRASHPPSEVSFPTSQRTLFLFIRFCVTPNSWFKYWRILRHSGERTWKGRPFKQI